MEQPSSDRARDVANNATVTAKINVINNYSSPKKFYIFQDLPKPTNGPSKSIFSNVYLSSPLTQNGKGGNNRAMFQISNTYYAIFGTNQGIGGNVVIQTSAAKEVAKLGPNGDVFAMTVAEGAPLWDTVRSAGKKTPQAGGFEFWTSSNFVVPNKYNIYIGVGAQDPVSNQVVPIQTWQAEPTLQSVLFPKITYYVCTGDFEPGRAVDKLSMGQWCKLEFEGAAIPEATIVFTPNATFQDDGTKTVDNGIGLTVGEN